MCWKWTDGEGGPKTSLSIAGYSKNYICIVVRIDVPRVTKPAGGRGWEATNAQESFLGRYDERWRGALRWRMFIARGAGARAQSPRVIAAPSNIAGKLSGNHPFPWRSLQNSIVSVMPTKDRSFAPLNLLRGTAKGTEWAAAKKSQSGFLGLGFAQRFWLASRPHATSALSLILAPLVAANYNTSLASFDTMTDTTEGDTSRSPRFTHWCALFVFRCVA